MQEEILSISSARLCVKLQLIKTSSSFCKALLEQKRQENETQKLHRVISVSRDVAIRCVDNVATVTCNRWA